MLDHGVTQEPNVLYIGFTYVLGLSCQLNFTSSYYAEKWQSCSLKHGQEKAAHH